MHAVVVRRRSDPRLEIAEVDVPVAGMGDLVVDVDYIALNPGELRSIEHAPDGARIGWDFAGRVARPAESGGGPALGARVVGLMRRGAWAERIAVQADMVAELPDAVDMTEAVCLPVPAMTAFVSLRSGGFIYGKRVLVTGAAGAVGQYVCQLALASGAKVSASVRREAQMRSVTCHGAVDVRVTKGVDAFFEDGRRFDLIIDIIGTNIAEQVPTILKPGGVYVLVAAAGGESVTLPILDMIAANGRVQFVNLFAEIERGPETGAEILERLTTHLAEGYLTAIVGEAGRLSEIDEIARRYMASEDRSKPVVRVNGGAT